MTNFFREILLFFDEGRIGKKDQNGNQFWFFLLPPALSGRLPESDKIKDFAKHQNKSGRTCSGAV